MAANLKVLQARASVVNADEENKLNGDGSRAARFEDDVHDLLNAVRDLLAEHGLDLLPAAKADGFNTAAEMGLLG